ncbi:MAG: YcaO-like family protein, partial [Desulfovibrio sp.]|nr:YcaO-like family protein [Desulfovibrio sp.]
MFEYTYTHTQTVANTGYFSCEPPKNLDRESLLARLVECPFDTFLHRHLLQIFCKEPKKIRQALAAKYQNKVLSVLFMEVARLCGEDVSPPKSSDLLTSTPLPWILLEQQKAPQHEQAELQGLLQEWEKKKSFLAEEHLRRIASSCCESMDLRILYQDVVAALLEQGILVGQEMRHINSLAPIGLLRHWQIDQTVEDGSLCYHLAGEAICYGRGLSLLAARISCCMEIVERVSSYVSVHDLQVSNRRIPLVMERASYFELCARGRSAIDPTYFCRWPAKDVRLAWVLATTAAGEPCYVPGQCCFLFANWNEPELADMSSTG